MCISSRGLQTEKGNVAIENMEMIEESVAFSAMKVNDVLACDQVGGPGMGLNKGEVVRLYLRKTTPDFWGK